MDQSQLQNKLQLINNIKLPKLWKQAKKLIPFKLKEMRTEEEQWNMPNNKLTSKENLPLSVNTEIW